MKEILFRGKLKRDGEWVEGYYLKKEENKHYMVDKQEPFYSTPYFYEVIPETVGQYTGLTDKNGKKIFEGDVVKKHSYIDYDNYANSEEYIGVVAFSDCAWTIETKKISHPIIIAISYTDDVKHFEIIGNIHDNPELKGE